MNKEKLQKLAGLLKEEDFDLSDNPLQMSKSEKQSLIRDIFRGLEEGDSVTILRDDIVKIFPKYEKKLEAFAKLEDDLYNAFEALYMEDDDLNEEEDFDLSDNPMAIRNPKEIRAEVRRSSSVWHRGTLIVNGAHFAKWLKLEHNQTWQEIYNEDEVEYYLTLYIREYDYSDHADVDWEETDHDIENYEIEEYEAD
jgi:hypothetical protein